MRQCTMSHFLIKRARTATNLSIVRTCMCLTITKITINICSKFSCVRPFYVIFVIVILNWQIWCRFLIVNGLVLQENKARCKWRKHKRKTLRLQIEWGYIRLSHIYKKFEILCSPGIFPFLTLRQQENEKKIISSCIARVSRWSP